MRSFCIYEFGRCWQVQRLGSLRLVALLLSLGNITSGVSLPHSAGGLAVSQPKVSLLHSTFGDKHKTVEVCSSLWRRKYVDSVLRHNRVCQQNKEVVMDTRRFVYIARSNASFLHVTSLWQIRRPAIAAAQNLEQAFDCSLNSPSTTFCVSGQVTFGLHRCTQSRSSSSLQVYFLSGSRILRRPAKSFLPPSHTAQTATTAVGSHRCEQLARARLLLKQRAARWSAASSALLPWKSGLRKEASTPRALHSLEDDGDSALHPVEEAAPPPVENGDVDEIEEFQEITEERHEASSKGEKDGFETAVTDEVLRGMVRSRFLYDEEEDAIMMQTGPPFIIDGPQFNGSSPFASPPWGPMKRMVPYNRSLASLPPTGDADAAVVAPSSVTTVEVQNATESTHDFWTGLAKHTTNWDFYAEPGSRVQGMANNAVLVTPPVTPNRVFLWTKDDIERGAFENPYADGTVCHKEPSYLNPVAVALRTGRRRDLHRRTDTGKKQKRRWSMENVKEDIPRGNWTFTDDIYKDMLDSVDWEREWPHLHDKNYYKRSHYSTLTGDNDRNEDSYWDPQFIGGVDTYPRVLPAGMNFTWPVYWVPWLCKKHPRRGGQPLKSEPFNLGGVEPLQLWFYPDGCELSHPGFCSLKLVSRPGWHLPFQIRLWIQGSTVDIPVGPVSRAAPHVADGPVAFRGEKRTCWREETPDKRRGGAVGADPPERFERFVSRIDVGPVQREAADYVAYATSFCRLLDKNSFVKMPSYPFPPFGDACPPAPVCFNPATDVVLGAAGDVEIGVAIAEDNWEWDDGHWSIEQWLKLQSAYPDDLELEETLPAGFTNSDMFENFKYRDVPDKHYAKYLPSALPPALEGENFDQMALNHRHAY